MSQLFTGCFWDFEFCGTILMRADEQKDIQQRYREQRNVSNGDHYPPLQRKFKLSRPGQLEIKTDPQNSTSHKESQLSLVLSTKPSISKRWVWWTLFNVSIFDGRERPDDETGVCRRSLLIIQAIIKLLHIWSGPNDSAPYDDTINFAFWSKCINRLTSHLSHQLQKFVQVSPFVHF